MRYNLRAIAKLINQALTDEEFNDLVQYDFQDVKFTLGMTKSQQVRLLLEYVQKRQEIERLLNCIKDINSIVYEQFEDKIIPSSSQPTPVSTPDISPVPDTPINPTPPNEQLELDKKAESIPKIEKCDILILAANPYTTEQLELEKEAESIRKELQEGANQSN